MDKREEKFISKKLSYILRHHPESAGIKLDENGWANLDELIVNVNKQIKGILSFEIIKELVENNDKQRFTFNDNFTKIRANQGHSVKIDLKLDEINPPEFLFHGTATKNIDSIIENGINKGNRLHVHLSKDIETASKVGQRHGKLVLLKIRTKEMYEDKIKIYLSKNGVYLVDFVDKKYIDKVGD